jgi:hypothetical protein
MGPIQEMIATAKNSGFAVFAPENLTSYFWITDGQRVGYCQFDNLRGPTFSTVHKANKYTGTGYGAANMHESLQHKPNWATNDGANIVKYSGPAEFIAKHWQKLISY